MTNAPRRDAEPERDHLAPADLLSDDPTESVDPRSIRTRTQSSIGPGTCAALRDALRGSDKNAAAVANGLGVPFTRSTLQRHYRGRCKHTIDAEPVCYNHSLNEWQTDFDNHETP